MLYFQHIHPAAQTLETLAGLKSGEGGGRRVYHAQPKNHARKGVFFVFCFFVFQVWARYLRNANYWVSKKHYLDNNKCAPSFLRSLCEIGGDCFGSRTYFSEGAQLPKKNGAKLLLS